MSDNRQILEFTAGWAPIADAGNGMAVWQNQQTGQKITGKANAFGSISGTLDDGTEVETAKGGVVIPHQSFGQRLTHALPMLGGVVGGAALASQVFGGGGADGQAPGGAPPSESDASPYSTNPSALPAPPAQSAGGGKSNFSTYLPALLQAGGSALTAGLQGQQGAAQFAAQLAEQKRQFDSTFGQTQAQAGLDSTQLDPYVQTKSSARQGLAAQLLKNYSPATVGPGGQAQGAFAGLDPSMFSSLTQPGGDLSPEARAKALAAFTLAQSKVSGGR